MGTALLLHILLQNGAVHAGNHIVIFGAAHIELDFIFQPAVVIVLFHLQALNLGGGEACMGQGDGLGLFRTDVGTGRGLSGLGGVGTALLLHILLQNGAVHAGNHIVIFGGAHIELDFVFQLTVVIVPFHPQVLYLGGGDAGGFQGDGFGFFRADVRGSGDSRGRIVIVVLLGVAIQNLSGVGLDLVFVLLAALVQLHLIVGGYFVQLRVYLPGQPGIGEAGVGLGDFQGFVPADGHLGSLGLCHLGQLLHREGRQLVKGEISVLLDGLNQSGLANGDVVLSCLILQLLVRGQGLAEDRGLGLLVQKGSAHLIRQLLLQPGGPLDVCVLHGNQNGGGDAVQVAMLQKASHNGVHRHIQVGALQGHIRQHFLGFGVESLNLQHLFAAVDL